MTRQPVTAPSIPATAPVLRGETCEHGGRWVVDVPTRRVVKRPCALCTPAARDGANPGGAAA